jgi:hypothetical protein
LTNKHILFYSIAYSYSDKFETLSLSLAFSVNKKLKEDYIKFWKDKLSLDGSEENGNKLKEKYEIENFLKLDIVRSDVSNLSE